MVRLVAELGAERAAEILSEELNARFAALPLADETRMMGTDGDGPCIED
ncbi:hypothetical protein [Actinomadura chibensis]|nr:hypothetical protein [Actinomadura chibensis]